MSNLKVGDKVMRKKEYLGYSFLDDAGPFTVTAVTSSGLEISLNRPPANWNVRDHWNAKYFDKIEEVEGADEYILILKGSDGKLKPASNPRVYSSEAQAKAVAVSMAEKHPGQEFLIFKAVGKAKTNAVVVEMF